MTMIIEKEKECKFEARKAIEYRFAKERVT